MGRDHGVWSEARPLKRRAEGLGLPQAIRLDPRMGCVMPPDQTLRRAAEAWQQDLEAHPVQALLQGVKAITV